MNPILSAGVFIGVLCGLWTFVMGFTGWYKDPVMLRAFFLVIPIEIAGLIWGLRRTAAEGRNYRSQIVAGTLMAVVAGVIVIGTSLIFTTVAFPDYFEHREAGGTPMGEAMSGFMGTLFTGIVASAIIAVFVRRKQAAPRSMV